MNSFIILICLCVGCVSYSSASSALGMYKVVSILPVACALAAVQRSDVKVFIFKYRKCR